MSKHAPKPPEPLQADHVTARVIREEIWEPPNLQNDWRVFAVVGRENSGKSMTCASILKAVDPDFDANRTHFEPVPFLEDISRELDKPGVAMMGDEVGAAFGNRTWHDREQIEANQALQTARDYNRIIGLTAPRFEEIDSQLRGRVHALLEAVKKKEGHWVEVKWKRIDPSRSGQNKIYKKYPKKYLQKRQQKVERLKIGPPPDDYIDEYLPKKSKFQNELFDRVIDRFSEESDGREVELESPRQIASHLLARDDLEEFIAEYRDRTYIDQDLVAVEYDIGDRKAKKVKKAVEKEVDVDDYTSE